MAHRLCTSSVFGSLVFACAMGAPAMAEDASGSPADDGAADSHRYEVADDDVSLNLEPKSHQIEAAITPYIWLPSLSGSTTVKGTELDVDQTFLDTLDKSEFMFGLMGAVDLRVDRFVFQLNGAWTISEYSGNQSPDPAFKLKGDLDLQTLWMEFFGGYRFIDHPLGEDASSKRRLILDGFVGVRYTRIWSDGSLKISESFVPAVGDPIAASETFDLDGSQDWFEPFIGLRFGYDLTDHWAVMIRGDVGGFGAGSDFAWQVFGGVGYKWYLKGWTISAFGGFRALGQDYTDGDFTWDVITYGPVVGAQFSFPF